MLERICKKPACRNIDVINSVRVSGWERFMFAGISAYFSINNSVLGAINSFIKT